MPFIYVNCSERKALWLYPRHIKKTFSYIARQKVLGRDMFGALRAKKYRFGDSGCTGSRLCIVDEHEREIGRFFDCCETQGQRKMNARISRRARRELIRGLRTLGVEDRSVLEIGSGPGDLTRRLIALGASRALGLDLAEQTVEQAREHARKEQVSDKVTYRIGNGAKEHLDVHDIVVLDKVICCYPHWRELVDNTATAARKAYGFVIPRSQGLGSILVRGFIAIQRWVLELKKCGFKPYVHDYSKIDSRLGDLGFERSHLYLGPIWMTAVYARSSENS